MRWRPSPEAVIDTSCQSRVAAQQAADTLGDVSAYAFVSSLNAYENWPPGPVLSDHDPTWRSEDDEYGPIKAAAERLLTEAIDGSVLLARAGLILGPYDPVDRLGWWLRRIAAGGRVVVPTDLDQPIAFIDARDLSGWLVTAVEQSWSGPVNATGPAGMITYGGLLELCRDVTGSRCEFVGFSDDELLAAGVQEWLHLPLWLSQPVAATAWQVDTTRARELELPGRPARETVADSWSWLQTLTSPPTPPRGLPSPGLPVELETQLLATKGTT